MVTEFEFDEKILYSGNYLVRFFEKATKEWLEFVINNRGGMSTENYDFVMGPVANDALYATILLYELSPDNNLPDDIRSGKLIEFL